MVALRGSWIGFWRWITSTGKAPSAAKHLLQHPRLLDGGPLPQPAPRMATTTVSRKEIASRFGPQGVTHAASEPRAMQAPPPGLGAGSQAALLQTLLQLAASLPAPQMPFAAPAASPPPPHLPPSRRRATPRRRHGPRAPAAARWAARRGRCHCRARGGPQPAASRGSRCGAAARRPPREAAAAVEQLPWACRRPPSSTPHCPILPPAAARDVQ